jgi:hypothetical protein
MYRFIAFVKKSANKIIIFYFTAILSAIVIVNIFTGVFKILRVIFIQRLKVDTLFDGF